jgi:CBS domain-containing protein
MRQAASYQKSVVTIDPGAGVDHAAERMQLEGVGCLVVVADDGHPVGVLTDRDLAVKVIAAGRDPTRTHVSGVMTRPPITATPDDPLERIVELMRAHGIRRVPIARDGKLVGIVSADDLLVTFAQELGDIGGAARSESQSARRAGRARQIARDVEDRLFELVGSVERIGDRVHESVVDELGQIRDRIRKLFDA